MGEVIIKAKNLTKEFTLYKSNRQRLISELFNLNKGTTFTALDDVNFKIEKGEKVAILGRLGSGRSTLVKILAGVIFPTSGKVSVKGKVTPVFDTKMGFITELPIRENIALRGVFLGLDKDEIKAREDEILEFSELAEIADKPLRMCTRTEINRLGFAICTSCPKDIIMVDQRFTKKGSGLTGRYKKKLAPLAADEKKTMIIVSNSGGLLRRFCTRGIVLDKGKLIFDGSIKDAIAVYKTTEPSKSTPRQLIESIDSEGVDISSDDL